MYKVIKNTFLGDAPSAVMTETVLKVRKLALAQAYCEVLTANLSFDDKGLVFFNVDRPSDSWPRVTALPGWRGSAFNKFIS